MANKKLLFLVVWIAVCVGMCRCWVEDVAEDANYRAEEVKENTESLAGWAPPHAFSKNLAFANDIEQQASQNIKYKPEHATSRPRETIKSAASGASEYASQKATDTKEAISGAMAYGREKASVAYNGGGEYDIIKMPIDKMAEAKDTIQDTYAMDCGRDKAFDVYEEVKERIDSKGYDAKDDFDRAKNEVGEAYMSAKDSISLDMRLQRRRLLKPQEILVP